MSGGGSILDNEQNDGSWNTSSISAAGSVDDLPFHNSTATTAPKESSSNYWNDTPMTFVVSCVLLIILCFCAIPGTGLRRGEVTRQAREQQQRRRRQATLADPKQRELAVAEALSVKQITEVNKLGEFTLGEPTGADDLERQQEEKEEKEEEASENDQEDSVCAICLEPFRVHDVVAWSRHHEECQHVFHRECIESWLEKQDDCPSCRTILLQYEEEEDTKNPEEGAPLGSSTMAYFIINGLVSRARNSLVTIGQSQRFSFDQFERQQDDDEEDSLGGSYRHPSPAPAPVQLRRVFSLGDHRLPKQTQNFRRRVAAYNNANNTNSQQQQQEQPHTTAIQLRRVVSTGSPTRGDSSVSRSSLGLSLRRVSSPNLGEALLAKHRYSSILWRDTDDTDPRLPSVPVIQRSVSWKLQSRDEEDGLLVPSWNHLLPQPSSEYTEDDDDDDEDDIILAE
jgi:hypothetical protein